MEPFPQRGLKTLSTAPKIIIEGIDEIIKRDLEKHKAALDRSKVELLAYKEARSHEIKKKKHYRKQIGNGKYNDEALKRSMNDIAINIRHMSDKVKLSEDAIAHHTLIVDTLTDQLEEYNKNMKEMIKNRK